MKKQLLCPTVCCCPEILIQDDGNFIIKDDHGQKVFLSKEDINKIAKDINELDSMSGDSLDNQRQLHLPKSTK